MLLVISDIFLAELQRRIRGRGRERILYPELYSNAPYCPKPDSNTADCASQSECYTPTVTTCWPGINMEPLKG